MEPYLFIDEKEWKYILETYEKDDVIEELSKALHTYPCPIPEISEKDTLKSLIDLCICFLGFRFEQTGSERKRQV